MSAAPHKTVKFSELAGFSEKQLQAVAALDTHKFVFYGGAKGGGKSYLIRWYALLFCLRCFTKYGLKGVRVMIACDTYASLHDRQLVKVQSEYPSWMGTYKSSEREFHLKPEYGGGAICFRNLDDPEKYHSAEYALICVDELTLLAEHIFQILRSCLRWPGLPDEDTKFLGTGNPQGKGLGWVKRLWIDGILAAGEDPANYAFVQALAFDNPHIASGYVQSLRNLPEQLRKAYLFGDWNVFRGQFFSEWREEVHGIPWFPIPRQWPRFRSLDWGQSAPSSVGWWARSPEGKFIRYKEFYGPGKSPDHLAHVVTDMTDADEIIIATIADPDIFKRRNEQTGITIGQALAIAGLPCVPANADRLAGWARMKEWLTVYDVPVPDPAVPGAEILVPTSDLLFFKDTCRDSIRTIPNMVHLEKEGDYTDDMVTLGVEDHAADDVRYFLMHFPPREVVKLTARRGIEKERIEDDNAWRARHGFAVKHESRRPRQRSAGW